MKKSQTLKLKELLDDMKPHRTDSIIKRVYGMTGPSVARVGARIADLKTQYGYEIQGWHDKVRRNLYWYQVTKK